MPVSGTMGLSTNARVKSFLSPGKSLFRGPKLRSGGKFLSGGINTREIKLAKDNLLEIEKLVNRKTVELLGHIVVDLLANAMPRVPYETGELRESGSALLRLGGSFLLVGKGTADGKVMTFYNKIKKKDWKNVSKVSADVHFFRTNDKNEDIALWAHEILQPYIPRPKPESERGIPHATKQYTGPKYLETPWNEKKGLYAALLKKEFKAKLGQDLAKCTTRVSGGKSGRPAVDLVKIVQAQLDLQWSDLYSG